MLRYRKARETTEFQDRADFGAALALWSEPAFSVYNTPREFKRFLNQARFVASAIPTGPDGLVDPNFPLNDAGAVAFSALAHLDESIVRSVADNIRDVLEAIRDFSVKKSDSGETNLVRASSRAIKVLEQHIGQFQNSGLHADAAREWLRFAGNTQIGGKPRKTAQPEKNEDS